MRSIGSKKSKRTESTARGFRSLILWQRMTELVKLIYQLTEKLPKSELFGLVAQMRRAVVSVLSNEVCLILGYFNNGDFEIFSKKRPEVGYLLYQYKNKII